MLVLVIRDPLRNIPEVLVETKAAGFDEIGRAVFDMLAAAVGRITSDPGFSAIPAALTNMRAPLVLYRTTHSGIPYAQGKWRPRVGGAFNVSTAGNWNAQVARHGHAVIDRYPILHVTSRNDQGLPADVWVLDVVMDWVNPGDAAFEPVRIYFGARRARVQWADQQGKVLLEDSRFVEGELPETRGNAPVTQS